MLDVLLHGLALVLVLEPERLVLHDLLLLRQVRLRRSLLRRHPALLLLLAKVRLGWDLGGGKRRPRRGGEGFLGLELGGERRKEAEAEARRKVLEMGVVSRDVENRCGRWASSQGFNKLDWAIILYADWF